jgi:LmbE family N-acetylglucosaminyl deacetylase
VDSNVRRALMARNPKDGRPPFWASRRTRRSLRSAFAGPEIRGWSRLCGAASVEGMGLGSRVGRPPPMQSHRSDGPTDGPTKESGVDAVVEAAPAQLVWTGRRWVRPAVNSASGAGAIRHFKNVLVVFPHADDETVTCGGTIRRLADEGATVTLMLLTGGELGNPTGTLDLGLKATRRREVERAASILGVSRVIQEYFRDGRLSQQTIQAKSALARTMTYLDPDLIITGDAAGLDGHPDHVACSEAVTEMRRLILPHVALWYVALPAWPLTLAPHLGKMARDPRVDARPLTPTHRVFIGSAIGTKIRASYAHRSQRSAKRKGLGRLVPPWILVSLLPFEYFTEA